MGVRTQKQIKHKDRLALFDLKIKSTSKNVIPAKAGIQKSLTTLDSRLRGSDKLVITGGGLARRTVLQLSREPLALSISKFRNPWPVQCGANFTGPQSEI